MRKAQKIRRGILFLMRGRDSFTLADVTPMVNLSFDEIVAAGGGSYLGLMVDNELLLARHQPTETIYSVTESGKRFADDVLHKTLPE